MIRKAEPHRVRGRPARGRVSAQYFWLAGAPTRAVFLVRRAPPPPIGEPRKVSMKPRFEILPAAGERTIRLRMSGEFDVGTMQQFLDDYKRITQPLAGSPHLILADLRG